MSVDSSSPTSRISNAQSAAAKAEREAAERVTRAQKQIRDADKEAETQLNHLRDQYEKRTATEQARGENYIETVRNRNYETVAETRRKGETEEARLARIQEKELRDLEAEFERRTSETAVRGESKLKEATKQNFTAQEYERQRSTDEIAQLKASHDLQKAALLSEQATTHEALAKQTQEARKTNEEKSRTAIETSHDHYQGVYEGALKQTKDTIADVNWRAAREVEAVKRDTSLKLAGYSSQKNDPFYRMVNLNARLTENDQQFILTAKIPEHERDRVNINLRGNDVVISGKRKSDEILEIEPGHTQRTSAYQTYSETFPLNWPVNPKNMTREWDGDSLIVRIPKKTTYEAPRQKKEVARSTLERPAFPANLPTAEKLTQDQAIAEHESTPPSKRKKAGSSLA
jgi:HSP20 family molecular chaperone IbpA